MKKMKLSDITEVIAGQSPPSNTYNKTGLGMPFFQGKADFQEKYPRVRSWCTSKKRKEAKKGDVLISVRAPVGSVNICNQDSIIGRGLSAIRSFENISSEYIYYFLKSNEKRIASLGTGSTFNAITQSTLKQVEILIPTQNNQPFLNDQIRIATLLSRIEALIVTRKENLILLDEFLKSTFLEMFGDPVRNEKEWDKKSINSFANVRIGPFGSLLHAKDYVVDGIPLINPSHIVNGKIKPDFRMSLTEKKYQELNKYHLKKNDVVVARRGEIGRCAIVLKDENLFCGTGSMFIRINNNYSPLFLQFQIFNTTLRNYLESKAKGVTMKNLNSKVLGNLKVLVPPNELMNNFIEVTHKTESIKSRYQQNLSNLENLYGAVSQKAFKGELDLSQIPLPDKELKEEAIESLPVHTKSAQDDIDAVGN